MEHFFTLPVIFNDEELSLPGRMVTHGHTFKLYIIVNELEVVFERNAEMKYQATSLDVENSKQVDGELLEGIIATLENLSEKSTVVFSYPAL